MRHAPRTPTLAVSAALIAAASGLSVATAVAAPSPHGATELTKAAKIKSAMSAAPRSVSGSATILDYPNADGKFVTLRAGSNDWTCLPDDPSTPGNDPICADAQVMKWFDAWVAHEKPKLDSDGFAYMLKGASDASNTDPFATEPAPGEDWMSSSAHVMVFPKHPRSLRGVTTDMDNGGPWVMFAGTPYAHMMIPTRSPHAGMTGMDMNH
ncbi:MAG TPA: hypothetical protein VNC22_12490 [Sporichthya sp.]|nr:hypothetical protein [Sporichthya sp.]